MNGLGIEIVMGAVVVTAVIIVLDNMMIVLMCDMVRVRAIVIVVFDVVAGIDIIVGTDAAGVTANITRRKTDAAVMLSRTIRTLIVVIKMRGRECRRAQVRLRL